MSDAKWLATKISMHLPGGPWSPTLARDDMTHYALLTRLDGQTIYVRLHEGKATAGTQEKPVFARDTPDLHGFGILKHDEPRIKTSFNPNRDPKAIAGQIARNVLAPFDRVWPEYQRRLAVMYQQRDELAQAYQEIAELMGLRQHPHFSSPDRLQGSFYVQDAATGTVEFSTYRGGSVKVELNNLTFDDARALARWIAGRNQPLGTKE